MPQRAAVVNEILDARADTLREPPLVERQPSHPSPSFDMYYKASVSRWHTTALWSFVIGSTFSISAMAILVYNEFPGTPSQALYLQPWFVFSSVIGPGFLIAGWILLEGQAQRSSHHGRHIRPPARV